MNDELIGKMDVLFERVAELIMTDQRPVDALHLGMPIADSEPLTIGPA